MIGKNIEITYDSSGYPRFPDRPCTVGRRKEDLRQRQARDYARWRARYYRDPLMNAMPDSYGEYGSE